jgi:hypothetical protein
MLTDAVCFAGHTELDALTLAHQALAAWSSREDADRLTGIMLSSYEDRDPKPRFNAYFLRHLPDPIELAACWEDAR